MQLADPRHATEMIDLSSAPPAVLPPDHGIGKRQRPSTTPHALLLLHRCLRGHYPATIVLALLIGAAGWMLGWRSAQPVYRSEGLIQIKYAQPPVDPTFSDNAATPFDVFMQSQQTLITSRRVVDKALRDPIWLAVQRPGSTVRLQGFASNLAVETKARTEYLKITYTDPDANVAAAAVQAVTNAYAEVYNEDEQHIRTVRLKVWKQNRQDILDRIQSTQKLIEQTVAEFGSANLIPLHDAAMLRASQLDSALQDLRIALAANPNAKTASGPTTRPWIVAVAQTMTPEQIQLSDQVMRGYMDERQRLEDQLDTLKLRGFMDSSRDVVVLKNSLRRAQERIDQRANEFNAVQQATGQTQPDAPGVVTVARTPAQLREEEARLQSLSEGVKHEMVKLETARLEADRRQSDLRRDREQLDQVTRMIDTTQDQDQMGGRLTVLNAGEVPLSPMKDNRPRFAAAGAFGGASIPVGFFALLGLIHRRYRYSEETAEDVASSAPVLAILPTLPNTMSNRRGAAEQRAGAAQRVHQIRVMLQVGRSPRDSSCYLVSSASPGEGKTSVTMSLGLSFAASGSRTLVIDADMVGRQVTRGLQAEGLSGLHEALHAGSMRGHLRQTTGGLFVLPVGGADPRHACTISPLSFERLLSEARQHFQAILIDSGPILGSVEASLVAQHADGVLLIVARGQHPPMVQRAMDKLRSMGASICGVVFNRAEAKDYQRSGWDSSSRSGSLSALIETQPEGRCRFGPLVAAVAGSLPVTSSAALPLAS